MKNTTAIARREQQAEQVVAKVVALQTSKVLSEVEATVVRNELTSAKLRELDEDRQNDAIVDLLSEIKVLTGAILSSSKEELALQVEVLKNFITSNPRFSRLTVQELRHAFYLNNQGEYDTVYRHYNRELNGEFIGDVLLAYVRYKSRIATYAAKHLKVNETPKFTAKDVTEEFWHGVIQQDYEHYLKGDTQWIYLNNSVYKLLRKYGGINIRSRAHWDRFIQRGIMQRYVYGNSTLLDKNITERENIRRVKAIYEQYTKDGWLPVEEYRMAIHEMRKALYFQFFEVMKYYGIKQIFKEIKTTTVWNCK